MDDVALTQNDNTVNIAHSPEGVGIYRDPLEILGSYILFQRVPVLILKQKKKFDVNVR